MLLYCDKCGYIWFVLSDNDTICDICNNTLKQVPDEYMGDGDPDVAELTFLRSDEMQQKLINDLVLTSPNFNQYYFDHKDEIRERDRRAFDTAMARGRAILEAQKFAPKCPICQSTNLSKISVFKKAAKISFFGLLGAGDMGKTYRCNNCGSKF